MRRKPSATRRSDRAVAALAPPPRRRHFVAGKLLLDEPVVRLVLVERADHVVAIAPCGRPLAVDREAIGLGKARQVEPVPGPPLAVARIGQQLVDHFFICVGRRVVLEVVHFLRRRRQSDQVEVHAPQQGALGCGRRRLHALGLELLQHKGVDRIDHPCRILHLRNRRSHRFVQQPVQMRIHFLGRLRQRPACGRWPQPALPKSRPEATPPIGILGVRSPRTYCISRDCFESPGSSAGTMLAAAQHRAQACHTQSAGRAAPNRGSRHSWPSARERFFVEQRLVLSEGQSRKDAKCDGNCRENTHRNPPPDLEQNTTELYNAPVRATLHILGSRGKYGNQST